ncbi:hypothetical protein EJ03DRAFT_377369 [Teratosphaeria nubilosa]|uniref:Uncharacterized protein n=1 Tax=Teratosphaeria nubilosa TaxID=161662 RepID=A0A6G1L0J5_9PEZI|nr:hypothetical protein EJ03DRAFT_377369 [Teratosphaeria nubilosa]
MSEAISTSTHNKAFRSEKQLHVLHSAFSDSTEDEEMPPVLKLRPRDGDIVDLAAKTDCWFDREREHSVPEHCHQGVPIPLPNRQAVRTRREPRLLGDSLLPGPDYQKWDNSTEDIFPFEQDDTTGMESNHIGDQVVLLSSNSLLPQQETLTAQYRDRPVNSEDARTDIETLSRLCEQEDVETLCERLARWQRGGADVIIGHTYVHASEDNTRHRQSDTLARF